MKHLEQDKYIYIETCFTGDTGPGVESWTRVAMEAWREENNDDFTFPHIKILYPTARKR